jgi:hypothetical protein
MLSNCYKFHHINKILKNRGNTIIFHVLLEEKAEKALSAQEEKTSR